MRAQDQSTPARSPKPTTNSLRLGVLLSLAGGYLDAFTFVGHHGVFANSQTGNMVVLGVSVAGGQWLTAMRHVPPLVAFVLGVVTAEAMQLPAIARAVRRPMRVALVVEVVVLAIVGALPAGFNDTVIVLTVAFVAAVQSTTFRTLRQWSFNSVITTGNLRTATSAAFRAVARRDAGAAEQAAAFGVICLGFLGGAAVGALLTTWWGNPAAWPAAAVLAVGVGVFFLDELRG
ncbi:DUF1275 domain-containing protein [Solihabitans fulvus]|uniref:DUF1275 domain-containing protein n=1 Tax=Solihabitans fulvus TaxID=1892852 RepID=A0A5B2WQP3_9PSEU|nr:YoaK family protein [Solihabitans fulvus]KAA2253825.1 DUF1275 domain-containing protein [Solihabitans fulvus]